QFGQLEPGALRAFREGPRLGNRNEIAIGNNRIGHYVPLGRIRSTSACGRGMTWTDTSSPTRRAAALPASVAAFTAPTSPRTMTVTYPAPIYSLPIKITLAAFTMASAASIDPISP